jgi:ATP-binding cassette subfamily B protein
MSHRRWLAPEVIQTSAMDCGPASLKSILDGFGIHVSYGRLREACQTDIDGTSIDAMEDVAARLGLDAYQTMVPLDHLLTLDGGFPAILVVRNPDGEAHFVVAWRRVGLWVQIMDPASGRQWVRSRDLLERTFEHSIHVPASAWREWAGTGEFCRPLRERLRRLGVRERGDALVAEARADLTCRGLATLDAAARLTQALVRTGGAKGSAVAQRLLEAMREEAQRETGPGDCIPPPFWSAAPAPPSAGGDARVLLRGAVLVRIRGVARPATRRKGTDRFASPELDAARREPPRRPLRELLRILAQDGVSSPVLVALATLAAAAGAALDALVLRGLLGASLHLGTWSHRSLGLLCVAAFFALCLGIELPLAALTLRIGRRLEIRFRRAFFAKLPRIHDRYFSSRPASDMSHRAHAIQNIRHLPQLGSRILRAAAQLGFAGAGLVWMDPSSWPFVLTAAVGCMVLPLGAQRALVERDRRLRAFGGALAGLFFDALVGLVPVRTHGAGPSLRREQERLLSELRRAFLRLLSATTTVEAVHGLASAAIAFLLLDRYLAGGGEAAGSLLLVYWSLALPERGADLARALRQYPELRNTTERLVEPLGAPEDEPRSGDWAAAATPVGPADLRLAGVDVRAAGNVVLEGVDLHVARGAHVAVVGLSGAGKSTLCGLFLGVHRPSRGDVWVDGRALRGQELEALRRRTAWVDPTVRLWNRSLLENVAYGLEAPGANVSPVLDLAGLVALLSRLPEGLQTRLGDGGALVSGGEGQRVRLARAMLRSDSRLVILDEPFRGLDRERRRELLRRARDVWRRSTLLCVTHDIGETLDFERVLVIDDRRIVEDGSPRRLAGEVGSRYRALLDAEGDVRRKVWHDRSWRRVELRAGVLTDASHETSR